MNELRFNFIAVSIFTLAEALILIILQNALILKQFNESTMGINDILILFALATIMAIVILLIMVDSTAKFIKMWWGEGRE